MSYSSDPTPEHLAHEAAICGIMNAAMEMNKKNGDVDIIGYKGAEEFKIELKRQGFEIHGSPKSYKKRSA